MPGVRLQFQDYNYAYLSTATGNISVSGGGDKFNLLSYFSKFNYVYNSKYLLSGSLRYDGSSKFGKNNRFALFPAVSAGWRISNEDFLANNKIISDLKLRASWGKNGSLATINSLASQTFSLQVIMLRHIALVAPKAAAFLPDITKCKQVMMTLNGRQQLKLILVLISDFLIKEFQAH